MLESLGRVQVALLQVHASRLPVSRTEVAASGRALQVKFEVSEAVVPSRGDVSGTSRRESGRPECSRCLCLFTASAQIESSRAVEVPPAGYVVDEEGQGWSGADHANANIDGTCEKPWHVKSRYRRQELTTARCVYLLREATTRVATALK